MKTIAILAPGLLVLPLVLSGCGGGGAEGTGNPDAAKVIGTAPDDPNYGAASADMMSKMHGGEMPGAKKAEEKK
jgi:hypothetical protein